MQYQPTNETTQNFDASIPTPWTFMKKKPGKEVQIIYSN